MARVIPTELFLMHRAAREGRRALREVQAMVHALAVAMRPLHESTERAKRQLDESERQMARQKAQHDRLYRTYQEALASPSLAQLEAARDSYARLIAAVPPAAD
ncbi:MAG: hypothetical protein HZC25_01875 [Rhodospirillales bacterium]|nr:hypothetical protein [Rhodospirillales bacterium]